MPYKFTKRDGVIYETTVKFNDEYELDIKICNGDTPWIDAVIFDKDGNQVETLDPTDVDTFFQPINLPGYDLCVQIVRSAA